MKLWSNEDGQQLWLLTPDEFSNLSDGTELICIDGKKVIKGKNHIDMDTRFGVIAFGLVGSREDVERMVNHE